jgi:hypothetical protein
MILRLDMKIEKILIGFGILLKLEKVKILVRGKERSDRGIYKKLISLRSDLSGHLPYQREAFFFSHLKNK